MYSISDYGDMIADKVRMDPYAYALKAVVGSDSVVLDIGTGTGIHALLACKFGARKVYAIEPNGAIHLARELAQVNGFADRIEFIQDVSTHVTLPERADVVVSDLRGVLPLYGGHIPTIVDARQRHLEPGGILIPKRDTVRVALVEAQGVYNELTTPWDHPYGLASEEARQIALNSWIEENTDTFRKSNLLMEPRIWAVLDYLSIDNPDVGPSNLIQKSIRDGTAHGLLLWFDGEIADGIYIFNGPQADKAAEVYGCGFFPLLEPVTLAKGDTITLDIRADLIGGQYIWRWHTRINSGDNSQEIKANFEQSTSLESSLENKAQNGRVLDFTPAISEEGKLDYYILGKMNGRTTLDVIAQQVQKKFPSRFKVPGESQFYVNTLSQEYGI
jgi:protein arginine N-methyltransferase 1